MKRLKDLKQGDKLPNGITVDAVDHGNGWTSITYTKNSVWNRVSCNSKTPVKELFN